MTRVPSPTISMAKRTALRLLVDSLRKQVFQFLSEGQSDSWVVYVTTWIVPFKRSSPVVL